MSLTWALGGVLVGVHTYTQDECFKLIYMQSDKQQVDAIGWMKIDRMNQWGVEYQFPVPHLKNTCIEN